MKSGWKCAAPGFAQQPNGKLADRPPPRKGLQVKKHVLATLFLSTLFAATAWAQDSGETTVRRYSGFGPTTGVVKWTVKQYDGLQAVDVTNAMYMPWDSAVEFCRQNFGGHGGWRLANRRDAERFVKAKDVKSGMFWIDERNTYYFVYPSTPVDIRVMNDPEKSGNDMSPLCVADGAAAQKAQGPRTDAGTSVLVPVPASARIFPGKA